jgi:conjugal transfer pilus assembly protein TraW
MEALVNTMMKMGLAAALAVCLVSSGFAQQGAVPTGVLAKDEAARLLEQRERAAATLNKDDELLKQRIKVEEQKHRIVNDRVFSREHAQARAEKYKAEAAQIVELTAKRGEKSMAELLASDKLVQKQLVAASKQDGGGGEMDTRYRLFVSQSMGAGGLKSAMAYAEANPDMVLVFKGIKRGQKLTDIMKIVTGLHVMKEGDNIPKIIIDPVLFEENSITKAPTLQRFDKDGNAIATARGVVNPKWMADHVGAGRRGDLGEHGAVQPIIEIDMRTLLQEQVAKFDFKAYGKRQVEQFWKQRDFHKLPHAKVNRTRQVDPSVVMTDTITAPDGTVMAYPGQRINPMDAAPFHMKLVVIDGRDDAQVAWARRLVVASEGKPIRVIATDFPVEGGWNEYGRLVKDIGRHVYLLDKHVAERFKLEKVPSTIEGGNRVLIVREYARSEISQGEGNARGIASAR